MPRSRLRAIIIVAATVSLFAVAYARQDPPAMFERARMLDEGNTNLAEAIKLYTQVATQTKDRALAARAQYRTGVLYERLGRKAEAQRAFKAVASQYPDQPDAARRAQARIVAASASGKADTNAVSIKRAGPSPDGRFLATFTFPKGDWDPSIAIAPAKQRLYVMTHRAPEINSEEGHRRGGRHMGLYVYLPSTLVVIDTKTNAIIKTAPFPVYLGALAYNPTNHKLYANASADRHLRVIDAETFATEAKIPLPGYPNGPAVNPVTNKIYVTNQGGAGNDKLFVIDGASHALARQFDLEGAAGGVIVNPATNRIYVSVDDKTRVFDGADESFMADLPNVRIVAADPVHNRLYAQTTAPARPIVFQALDGNSHALLASFAYASSAGQPDAVSTNPDLNRLYVPLSDNHQIAIIDTATNSEINRLAIAGYPIVATADRTTGNVYLVCHFNPGTPSIGVLAKDGLEKEAAPEEFFDNFEAATLDPAWIVGNGQGRYSLTENPGHLRFHVVALAGQTSYMALVRKFRGEQWTFETQVKYDTGKSGGGRTLNLRIRFGTAQKPGENAFDNFVGIGRYRDAWNDCCPGSLIWQITDNGANVPLDSLPPPSPADSYLWRIKRNGRMVTVERSDDGINFTLAGSHTFGPQIDGVIQYLSLSYNTHANNDAYADYDYVRLSKTTPTQPHTTTQKR